MIEGSQWSAIVEHPRHICVMFGDAKHSYLHLRDWDGKTGWQYNRFGYTARRTRKLRDSAVAAMLAAPGLSAATQKQAAEAVRIALERANKSALLLHFIDEYEGDEETYGWYVVDQDGGALAGPFYSKTEATDELSALSNSERTDG